MIWYKRDILYMGVPKVHERKIGKGWGADHGIDFRMHKVEKDRTDISVI